MSRELHKPVPSGPANPTAVQACGVSQNLHLQSVYWLLRLTEAAGRYVRTYVYIHTYVCWDAFNGRAWGGIHPPHPLAIFLPWKGQPSHIEDFASRFVLHKFAPP